MQELNLIPYKNKKQKYNSMKSKDKTAVAVIAAAIFVAALYLPYLSLRSMENNEKIMKQKYKVYENAKDQNTKYKKQVSDLQKYVSSYETISKSKVMVSTAVSGIQKYTPSSITLDSLQYNNKLVTINAHTTDYASIYVFAANLEQSKEYSSVRVGTINSNTDKKNYSFTITLSD